LEIKKENVLDDLRVILKQADDYETATAIMVKGNSATIISSGTNKDSQQNLISSFLLLAGILRQSAEGDFKNSLDHVLKLNDDIESGAEETRH
jgi:hypothetical protein